MRQGVFWLIFLLVFFIPSPADSAYLVFKGGPLQGKIIDAETGAPIEGVVFLAVWERKVIHPAGALTEFLEAKEAVTNKEGEFYIPSFIGFSLNPFTFIAGPYFTIFWPGYRVKEIRVTPEGGKEFKDPTVVEMQGLKTRGERLNLRRMIRPLGVPNEKMPNLLQLLQQEDKNLGLEPVR